MTQAMEASLFLLLVVVIVIISKYNKLVRKRVLMREGFSGMDVYLKQRHNLVPNLVQVVKAYSKHEHDVFKDISALRSQLNAAASVKDQGNTENLLTGQLKSLFALVEAYPELKADKNFLQLQGDLIEIEDQIQKSRRYYNGTVRENNILVQSFPTNLIAGMFGFKDGDFFELQSAIEREAPEAKFDS